MSRALVLAAAGLVALPASARADRVVLTNGHVIEVERAWYEGNQVRYELNGGVYGLPRSIVAQVEGAGIPATAPGSGPATAPAPPPLSPIPPPTPAPPSPFRIRAEGGVPDPALARAVLADLDPAYREFGNRLGFAPPGPITVVLLEGPTPDSAVPLWADGVNDGTIRIPTGGTDLVTPRFARVLRHELAHSFVSFRTGGNSPVWLQEGVSQWLEGGDPARSDGALAGAALRGRLLPLLTLEAPFQSLNAAEVPVAYDESLSAVAHILRLRGEPGLVRLLTALGDQTPSDEALPTALGLSYPEFQRSWEGYLKTLTVQP